METKITGITREVIEEMDRASFAKDGGVWLKSTTDLGPGAGIAPTGKYKAIVVGDNGVTISAITYLYPEKYKGAITDFTFTAGQAYFIEFSNLTITAGEVFLVNK